MKINNVSTNRCQNYTRLLYLHNPKHQHNNKNILNNPLIKDTNKQPGLGVINSLLKDLHYKIGDKVKIDFDYGRLGAASKPMKGKIIAIPNDGTIISNVCDYDVVKKAYNKQNIQWIKNNKNVLESVETFEDQPATGSVWYFDDSVSYRKCFVLLQNGVISLIPEFMIKSDSFFGWLS